MIAIGKPREVKFRVALPINQAKKQQRRFHSPAMAIVPMITNLISGLLAPCLALHARITSRNYWRRCRRLYTFQPIYRTSGALLALELLTAVYHPASPDQPQSPERYFSALGVRQRLRIIQEQLALLQRWQALFSRHALMVSVNIDGVALQALQHHRALQRQIAAMPYLRFELVEHAERALSGPLQQIAGAERLWLDDFGSGLANFSAVGAWRYQYIKVARELFTLLKQTDEGVQLLTTLVRLMNQHSDGVIVEGVETEQEWLLVQRSGALAAQGYYLSRPARFETLHSLPTLFAAPAP
ncbi:Cyclic di-GMP phosphodiesterase YhjH [Serratia ficaria]|uniref:Cyclic di-GMP phosphodiesterase YhjH n=2 Tax=Serratia TaxID=613 RepID=A0A240CFW6_SERFI|nr:EAL domain-containing protein (putative c-di-GMP-specific phosphodiesterase class I) [Serratia ficaria]CAI1183169.1 Cyclic di-GMP phosphodiesterase YhjH [Serratia ficaria]CAI1184379.1 Cyclic di-GMP phosphodiesterase YhjH [Serratia ficaria]CAI1199617.1 Cyclic di-GMP phosphodiesterase YhjH [Serratia ficaria]CAI1214703.1 Cyclic di-GMP phosphodiesterase YhjH [Serratia ficaria]